MAFLKVCQAADLQDRSLHRFNVNGQDILVTKLGDHIYALSERCTHRGGPLSEGTLEGNVLTCPLHFGQFDITTGEVVGPPPSESLPKFETKLVDGELMVSLQ